MKPFDVKAYYVYTYADPRTHQPAYVGCTRNFKMRHLQHTTASGCKGISAYHLWRQELAALGLKPELHGVAYIYADERRALDKEKSLVHEYEAAGTQLVNTVYTNRHQLALKRSAETRIKTPPGRWQKEYGTLAYYRKGKRLAIITLPQQYTWAHPRYEWYLPPKWWISFEAKTLEQAKAAASRYLKKPEWLNPA